MTNKLFITPRLLLGIVFALTIVVPVFGQGTDAPEVNQETTVSDQETTAEDRKTLRRTEHALKVDEARSRSIAGKCKGAQNKLSAQVKRAEQVKVSRSKVYGNLQEKLTTLSSRLTDVGVDTQSLGVALLELDELVVSFNDSFDAYQLALTDATALDCELDPEGFLLSIEDAKTQLTELKAQSKLIREFFTTTIIPAIQDAKANVENDNSTEGEEV